jgi:REP element-mobilizing transposase RayT
MFWRRRLPHWVPDDAAVFVTFRLAGTLPDQPGPSWLNNPRIADVVVEALLHGEGTRRSYDLFAWVIMSNHVHVVMKPHEHLVEVMRWLKTATATRANRVLRRTGDAFWQREYFDHWIRSESELARAITYIEENPVKAGLVARAEEWRWSSAFAGGASRF